MALLPVATQWRVQELAAVVNRIHDKFEGFRCNIEVLYNHQPQIDDETAWAIVASYLGPAYGIAVAELLRYEERMRNDPNFQAMFVSPRMTGDQAQQARAKASEARTRIYDQCIHPLRSLAVNLALHNLQPVPSMTSLLAARSEAFRITHNL